MSSDLITAIIGYTAAVVGTSMMVPQIYKMLKTKAVEDLSLGLIIWYIANCALWLAYGVRIKAMPMVLTNAIALIIGILQYFLWKKYKKPETK